MTRFVIGPDVALHLAERNAVVPAVHQLLAPTLLRSQVLAGLYARVRRGDLDKKAAERQLDHLRVLRVRLLGDRVLQRLAWTIADLFAAPSPSEEHVRTAMALRRGEDDPSGPGRGGDEPGATAWGDGEPAPQAAGVRPDRPEGRAS